MQGAAQLPSSWRMQPALIARGARASLGVHVRIGNAHMIASIAECAAEFELNGPRYIAPSASSSLMVRTIDRRGAASAVSFTQGFASALRDARL
jgi:hypothetical protein